MRRALPFLVAAAVIAVVVVGLTQAGGKGRAGTDSGGARSGAEAARALEGAPAPLADLYAKGGTIVPSTSAGFAEQLRALRGYPVVVNAWASWCGPCKVEFPYFRQASARLGKRVAFVGVNTNDNRDDAEAFLSREPVPYPHFDDSSGTLLREVAKGATGLPVTVFYDAEGKRAFIHQGGYRSEEDLIADIGRYTGA